MKWILPRNRFINEAKLRDVLSAPQKKVLLRVWGEKYLDYEEVLPTDRIKQGRWKLTEEDKDAVINRFFKTNYSWVREMLASLPDKFSEVLSKSLSMENNTNLSRDQRERVSEGFKDGFDIKKLKISQISCLNYPIFKQLNSAETKADTKVLKDEKTGLPVRDDDNNIIKVSKEPGDPSFSANVANINTFISGFNSSYPDNKVDGSIFLNSNIQNITNMIDDNPDIIDFDLFGDHEMYLLIEHNAVNIMNMSVSKFYKSCQELYFGGGHGEQYMKGLLANVFDPNTIPAFLIFNTPYYNITESGGDPEKLSDVLPLCRLLIRSIEPFSESNSETKLYFDKTYPERMRDILQKMIMKYSENEPADTDYIRKYPFAPDVQIKDWDTLGDPYMDNLDIVKGTRIGKNTKVLYLSNNYDWSNVIIDKDVDIKELIIETPDIPKNFFDVKFKPDWIKFKYISINDFSLFNNIMTNSVSLYQCKLNNNFLEDLYKVSPGLKSLSLGSVDVDSLEKLSIFTELEDLELLYTISTKEKLEDIIGLLNLKKLTISGDVIKNKDNKEYIDKLKSNGISVILKGLVL